MSQQNMQLSTLPVYRTHPSSERPGSRLHNAATTPVPVAALVLTASTSVLLIAFCLITLQAKVARYEYRRRSLQMEVDRLQARLSAVRERIDCARSDGSLPHAAVALNMSPADPAEGVDYLEVAQAPAVQPQPAIAGPRPIGVVSAVAALLSTAGVAPGEPRRQSSH
jgi:hypothetical protein